MCESGRVASGTVEERARKKTIQDGRKKCDKREEGNGRS